jgi:lysozyme
MKISQSGILLIKSVEGFRAKEYLCPAGLPTIGYGHVICKGENYQNGITDKEACELLEKDCHFAEEAVNALGIKLNQNQFDALVSFIYNIGLGGFKVSTMKRKLIKDDMPAAAKEFEKWVYVNGGKSNGLIRRRKLEKELFLL